jgi:hypothetical protein
MINTAELIVWFTQVSGQEALLALLKWGDEGIMFQVEMLCFSCSCPLLGCHIAIPQLKA